ncbi:MAG: ABC transporter permease [Erysipelotrichia bacterium]|nr:ABC transporter permease [Erysipelotrichia bacterium]
MTILLEGKKLRRTGCVSAFICGGLLAALVPVLNIAFRTGCFTNTAESPLTVLLNGNWQMMAMLNVLFAVAGACVMYHTEYADNAIQKMRTLSIRESTIFFGKFILMTVLIAAVYLMEAVAIAFCVAHWFTAEAGLISDMIKNFCYMFLMMIPAAAFSLVIASACRNMWVSLGIGIVCVFTATLLPSSNFLLSLFPYALPFQTLSTAAGNSTLWYCTAACIETVIAGSAELIYVKGRRSCE